jgi:hypothetical protein
MPIEERRIKFNFTEFKVILIPALYAVRNIGLDGTISKIETHAIDIVNGIPNKRIARDHEVPVAFTIMSVDSSGKTQTLELEHEFMLTTLIEHCIDQKIILARDFSKKAYAASGWVWLELSTPIEEKKPFGVTDNHLMFDE